MNIHLITKKKREKNNGVRGGKDQPDAKYVFYQVDSSQFTFLEGTSTREWLSKVVNLFFIWKILRNNTAAARMNNYWSTRKIFKNDSLNSHKQP